MNDNQELRILIAEDDPVLRRTLVQLLQLEPDFKVVAQAPSGEIAVAEATISKPHVILMDIDMPRLNGIDATRAIKAAHPEIEIVILTKFGDDENVFAAIKAGAVGYILKDSGLDEIRDAVRAAKHSEGHLNPALVARVMQEFAKISQQSTDSRKLFSGLTRREVEVLELLGVGMKNRAIADKLCLSEKTVKTHITAILKKLHVNDRTAAGLIAQKHGLKSTG